MRRLGFNSEVVRSGLHIFGYKARIFIPVFGDARATLDDLAHIIFVRFRCVIVEISSRRPGAVALVWRYPLPFGNLGIRTFAVYQLRISTTLC